MAKKSSEGIVYLVLAIAMAALIAWIWSKASSSKAAILANLQANAAAGSATVAVQTAPTSDVLIAPAAPGMLTTFPAPL